VQTYAVGLVNDHYNDFGPTLALEKLGEILGVMISQALAAAATPSPPT